MVDVTLASVDGGNFDDEWNVVSKSKNGVILWVDWVGYVGQI